MRTTLLYITLLLIVSCGENQKPAEDKKPVLDSSAYRAAAGPDDKGLQGIQDLPEMLTLAIRDSAVTEEISAKIGKRFADIQIDIEFMKLMPAGSPGTLFYTNDPKNFVFECVIPINKMPSRKPNHSKIVILEATRAIVYNYYGPYDKIYTAYDEIRKYMAENKLVQGSAAREFYITDPMAEKDSTLWLSKIYVPVN